MPTKEEIQNYLAKSHAHSFYSASVHFEIDIQQVYKIMEAER